MDPRETQPPGSTPGAGIPHSILSLYHHSNTVAAAAAAAANPVFNYHQAPQQAQQHASPFLPTYHHAAASSFDATALAVAQQSAGPYAALSTPYLYPNSAASSSSFSNAFSLHHQSSSSQAAKLPPALVGLQNVTAGIGAPTAPDLRHPASVHSDRQSDSRNSVYSAGRPASNAANAVPSPQISHVPSPVAHPSPSPASHPPSAPLPQSLPQPQQSSFPSHHLPASARSPKNQREAASFAGIGFGNQPRQAFLGGVEKRLSGDASFFPNQPVDVTLDDALASLSHNYNLADLGEIGEIDDHMLRDAFFGPAATGGESGDVEAGSSAHPKLSEAPIPTTASETNLLHSILEYEPGSLVSAAQSIGDLQTPEKAPPPPQLSHPATPPSSAQPPAPPPATAAAESHVTPKLREKMKMRKEKELADLDKAFEWHLSRVMERNEKTIPHPSTTPHSGLPSALLGQAAPTGSGSLVGGASSQDSTLSDDSAAKPTGVHSPVRFSPVHFSPANSPGPSSSSAAGPANSATNEDPSLSLSKKPSAPDDELKVFIALPEKTKKAGLKTKVPIYKQGLSSSNNASSSEGKNAPDAGGQLPSRFRLSAGSGMGKTDEDAYSFTDDEEPDAPDAVGALVDHLKERRLEEEVKQKLLHISSLHPELKVTGNNLQQQRQMARTLARQLKLGEDGGKIPKRRGRRPKALIAAQEAAAAAAAAAVAEGGTGADLKAAMALAAQLTEVMKRRKEQRQLNSFCSTAIAQDNATAVGLDLPASSSATSASGIPLGYPIKQEPSLSPTQHKPNIIIRIPKACITQPSEDQSDEEGDRRRRKRKKERKIKDDPDYRDPSERRSRRESSHSHRHKKHRHKDKRRDHHSSSSPPPPPPPLEEDNIFARIIKAEAQADRDKDMTGGNEIGAAPIAPMKIKLKLSSGTILRRSSDSSTSATVTTPTTSSSATAPAAAYSKKKRLMTGWVAESGGGSVSGAATRVGSEGGEEGAEGESSRAVCASSEAEEAAASQRLSQFRQPSGEVAKGTFLVAKEDIGTTKCPLWKVDNQNLLQKFTPSEGSGGGIVYKSSSTYSGWAAAQSERYLSVTVRYVEHSRSAQTVEPETPLVDLFPAVATEVVEAEGAGELLFGASRSPPECDQHQADAAASLHPLRAALQGYLHALLLHCLTGTFLQSVAAGEGGESEQQRAAVSELREAVSRVEKAREEKRSVVGGRAGWSEELRSLMETYPLVSCAEADPGNGEVACQGCGGGRTQRVLQLFANEFYDPETLESRAPERGASGSPLPAQERLVCADCCREALLFHRLSHMRYHLYKICEEKVEALKDSQPLLAPAALLDACLNNKAWLHQTADEYLSAWK